MMTEDDFFGMFGIPVHYRIDRAHLDQAYERLTLEHHPDFFANAPPEDREAAERTSAMVNEGYRVLTDDVLRTAYLIERLARGRALDTRALPEGFLQEMFLLQEEVEELMDVEESPRKDALRGEVTSRLDAVRGEQAVLFDAISGDPALEQVQSMQTNLNCERYLLRLIQAMDHTGEGNPFGHD